MLTKLSVAPPKNMRYIIIFYIITFFGFNLHSQNLSISAGTDIPYQFYSGASLNLEHVDFTLRTGILIPPYSDAILAVIQKLGTDEIYINLLDASFEFGWMNSIGAYYKLGRQKNYYLGGEFRFDYMTAADTPLDLVETIIGQSINLGIFTRNVDLILGLKMMAAGVRFGKSYSLSKNNKHQFKTELSINKYLSTQSTLAFNNLNLESINQKLDRLLWEKAFRKYGYVGGIGFAYSYTF